MENKQMNLTPLEKYEKIRESMRKANEKYRNANKDELNKTQKEMYDITKMDEEFKQKTRAKALAYYYRKKAEKKALESAATNE
jgi:hypothetical protein